MDRTVDAEQRINELRLCLEDMSHRNFLSERKVNIANNARKELDFLSTKLTHSQLMNPVLRGKLDESYMYCYFMASEEKPSERT